ncbi:uncharacterized protein LOC126401905 [Epinephelus moara]|uniref:uncharacterized protein LOC126401905 n=1 Tax=Epinephelus moara TaxID=300413 RepID=UPI00214E951A|nr:uncharacterized protein LOC126401905 [Epinephelus moara]
MEKKMLKSVTLFIFLSWTAVTAKYVAPIYKAVGDKVVLTPSPSAVKLSDPITNITWKHGPNIAVEWYGDRNFTYHLFEGRSMLNSSTGALTITGLTRNDSGNFTPEINGQVTKATLLHVISPVPKPTVSTWCDTEMTYCVFTCEGNTTETEPFTYGWSASDMVWLPSSKTHKVTEEETEPTFCCMLENPVSFKYSEYVRNPFFFDQSSLILAIFIMSIVVILLLVALLVVYICRKVREAKGAPQETSAMMWKGQAAVDEEAAHGSQT